MYVYLDREVNDGMYVYLDREVNDGMYVHVYVCLSKICKSKCQQSR
jgi:hypothetical protein